MNFQLKSVYISIGLEDDLNNLSNTDKKQSACQITKFYILTQIFYIIFSYYTPYTVGHTYKIFSIVWQSGDDYDPDTVGQTLKPTWNC